MALETVARQTKAEERARTLPQGRQSVRELMRHNVSTNTIPIEGDTGLFDRIARKWYVDYAFHQTGEDKYLLLFKSGQADAITAAFSEYSAEVMRRANREHSTIREVLDRAAELSAELTELELPSILDVRRERELTL